MRQTMTNTFWRQFRWHIVSFISGMLVGVMFAGWLRGIVTILFFAGLVVLAYFIWSYFEGERKR